MSSVAAIDTIDVFLRLGAATLAGAALGLNRDLHGKPTGLRTLALVGLGSALIVMVAGLNGDTNAVSRAIQGLVTGIGFLGAGVIIHTSDSQPVHGLTTAACVWLTACLGAACGVGEWRYLSVSVGLVLLVLMFGGPLEKALRRLLHPSDAPPADGPKP